MPFEEVTPSDSESSSPSSSCGADRSDLIPVHSNEVQSQYRSIYPMPHGFMMTLKALRDSVNFKPERATSIVYPINDTLVPLPVNPRQFDAIQSRRRIRFAVESARIGSGRPVNGRRQGKFKYLGRHIHATKRVRSKSGTFIKSIVDK
jgi:hypothetical protein